MATHRFPPRWSVEEQPAYFVVRDHNGQALAYVYFEDGPGRRSAAKLLTNDEARCIAVTLVPKYQSHCAPDRGEYREAAGANSTKAVSN